MTTFEHKGHTINFDERTAQFSTRINNKYVASGSLATVKKKIDGASTFEPFDAYIEPRNGTDKPETVRIVGFEKAGRNRRYDRAAFIDAGGKRHDSLLPKTDEALALWKASRNAHAVYTAESDRLRKIAQTASDAVPIRRAAHEEA